jgi:pyruvate/2-oxoglutarate dehydrogenase complex dihydrolipoamide acyltransferase (E2) component
MSYEVKMPQLGMNQDTAVVVAWFKKEGDKIEKGDPLFEVETDKATMEVEAQKEGYLSKIKVDEGSEVPVGQLLALISDTNEDSHNDQTDLADSDSFETIEPYAEPINDNSIENEVQNIEDSSNRNELSTRSTRNKAASTGVKVLASPKAKLAAKEMGFDLAELRNGGIAEPFHFADLARVPQSSSFSSIYLQVSAEAFDALILKSETVKRSLLFSKFTSSAWSFVFEESVLEVIFKDTNGESYVETTTKEVSSNDVANTITLIDLCDTRISAYETGSNNLTLSFSQLRNEFTICLSFSEKILQFSDAVKFLNELGARLEDPVLQLI